VTGIEDFAAALSKHKGGDRVEVHYSGRKDADDGSHPRIAAVSVPDVASG
jgi:hypothetical protein